MNNPDIARVFSTLATMLEIDGANPFRVRAYREGARVLDARTEPVAALDVAALTAIPGIGKDLAAKIRDLVQTGSTPLFDEMKSKVPLEAVALTELQGMGPKRVATLLSRGIANRAQLEEVAKAGGLKSLPGFGATIEKNLLKALASTESGRTLLGEAWQVAQSFRDRITPLPGVERVEMAGSFRRRKETVGDLDVLVAGGDAETVMKAFTSHPQVGQVLGSGGTKASVRLMSGLQVDLRLVPAESFGAALMYFTGSKQHNIRLRQIALDKKWLLNEYGLLDGERVIAGRTEEEIYRALGMEWIPPELREAADEIELAIQGRLPRLIDLEHLRGDLHMHTNRTDGRETLETMVRAARDRGYEYCAITDHSQALQMIGGFDTARVRKSVAEIAEVRKQVPGIHVLHGLEVDILEDGGLDLDDEGLAMLDWVIVSLHSWLRQPSEEMTKRVLRALSHPRVNAMGHPTGRQIGSREPAAFHMEAVLDEAARRGVWMEINSNPRRTDLNDRHARMARDRGVQLVIDTDAHSVPELDFMRYGVFAARRAGLGPEDVMNTRPWQAFEKARKSRPA
jgi:DNA polymerase (family X)